MNNATVIVFNHHGMGQAAPELSLKLARTYLELLDLEDRLPRKICFYAEGVKLASKDSPLLEDLTTLAEKGVELIVCTTCLEFFGLLEDLAVGKAGSMKDIIAAQAAAAKVITL